MTDDARFGMGPRGLVRVGEPTRDDWRAYQGKLVTAATAFNFVVGDWIVYGEERGWTTGKTYAEIARAFDRSEEWVSQVVRVARRWPRMLRAPAVVWTVYRELLSAPLARQQPLLEQASRERWTKDDVIRATVGRLRPSRERPTQRPRPTKWGGRNVRCPHCKKRFQVTQ